jgi:hypothetical protein
MKWLRVSGNPGWHALKGRGKRWQVATTPFAEPQDVPPFLPINSRMASNS